jgi:Sec-independent protein secretion pathway component TatC
MNLKQRLQAPTPSFFKKLRKWGLIIAAIGGAVITAPVSLPATVITVAGYLTVAGAVVSAVSQTATAEDAAKNKNDGTAQQQ